MTHIARIVGTIRLELGRGSCLLMAREATSGTLLGQVPLYLKTHPGPNDADEAQFTIRFDREKFPLVVGPADVMLSTTLVTGDPQPQAVYGRFLIQPII
jgi:hypothetical protein